MADLANILFCICFSPLFLRLTAPSDMGHLDPKATPGGSRTTGFITCHLATCLHASLAVAFLVSRVSSPVPFVLHTPFSLENFYLQLWDILALIRQLFSLSVAGFVLAPPFPLQSVLVLRTPLHPFLAVSGACSARLASRGARSAGALAARGPTCTAPDSGAALQARASLPSPLSPRPFDGNSCACVLVSCPITSTPNAGLFLFFTLSSIVLEASGAL